jgi:hypothetical protein
MNWFFVAVGVNMAGLGGLAVWLLYPRLRRQGDVGTPPVEWPRPFPMWGLEIECGIDAVNGEGKVVGTVLVPAPALN